jgi:hypothetical protein
MDGIFKYCKILALLVVLHSCEVQEKKTNKNLPYAGDKIVLYGFVITNQRIEVTVQKSLPLTCTECNDTIKQATVNLFEDGKLLCELVTENSRNYYTTPDIIPTTGHTYHIEVNAPGLPLARSEEITPVNPQKIDTAYLSYEKYFTVLHYSFTKNDAHTNFYDYTIQLYMKNGGIIDSRKLSFSYLSTMQINETGNLWRQAKFYIDKPSTEQIKFTLYQISDELVKYLKSQDDFESNFDDAYNDNPTPIYSNIIGGYGIFASIGKDSLMVVVK